TVSYKDTNPKIAARVVNTLINVYLESNVSSRRKEAAAGRKFIEKQVPKAESAVRQSEAELANFKEKNKVVSLEEEAEKSLEVISDLQRRISEAKSKIADITSQSEQIRKQLGMNSQEAVTMAFLSQSPGVQDIIKEIQKLESQLISRRNVLQDNHPEIISLENNLASSKELLQKRVEEVVGTNQQLSKNLQMGTLQQKLAEDLIRLESGRLGLASEITTLSQLEVDYRQRLNMLPKLEQKQRQLERKVQGTQSTYSLLLKKLQEARIAENQNLGNASKVAQAQIPDEPISSPMIIVSAGLLAILSTLIIVFLVEARDKSIKTVDEAKEYLGLTLLGVIPFVGKPKGFIRTKNEPECEIPKLVIRDFPRTPIKESYRILRANLKFMSADKELKVIVVTSSVPKEGKSTVAANLATVMAQMECNVLLVDGDLHHPIQHKVWELPNTQGLSNVIVGQAPLEDAIVKVMDNLDVLPAGVLPPSPSSLLDSRRMAKLMETFAANYDFVIIDSPSLNTAADVATLGQLADGVLLVVRLGLVDTVSAAAACELLEKSGQKVLGQVVNGDTTKNKRRSYYYFHEGYYPSFITLGRGKIEIPIIQLTRVIKE
ncbi:MAG: polysaccharide biosynthesis tyrosine autokinase, partial [Rivularia sp. ALOHA_DT_140]|nr:polysaccharide biosynthesis tyrosine autokinase [Rivularia sp. ALOHA_DT_140]